MLTSSFGNANNINGRIISANINKSPVSKVLFDMILPVKVNGNDTKITIMKIINDAYFSNLLGNNDFNKCIVTHPNTEKCINDINAHVII